MVYSTWDYSKEMGITGEGYEDSKYNELPQFIRAFCELVETVHSLSRPAR